MTLGGKAKFLTLFVWGTLLHANAILQQGAFSTNDQVQLFNFTVITPGLVTFQTYSYAGGTDVTHHVISSGGFDAVVTLFDAMGNLLNGNDDGPCGTVGHDGATGNCFDAYLSLNLLAGAYTLALTLSDNLAIGPTLADGFLQSGNGNFTCPQFLGEPGGFCDASPLRRTDAWALNIVTPDLAGSAPEPSAGLLLASSMGIFAGIRRVRNSGGKS